MTKEEIIAEVLRLRTALLSQGAATARMREYLLKMDRAAESDFTEDRILDKIRTWIDSALKVQPTHYEQYVKALEDVAKAASEYADPARAREILFPTLCKALARLGQLRGGKL